MEDTKQLETLSYRQETNTKPMTNIPLLSNYVNIRKASAKSSPEGLQENTPIIEPKTEVENSKVAAQPLDPNLKIIEEIEGLMSQVNEKLAIIDVEWTPEKSEQKYRIGLALEEIDLFQKTTLFELRKAFE